MNSYLRLSGRGRSGSLPIHVWDDDEIDPVDLNVETIANGMPLTAKLLPKFRLSSACSPCQERSRHVTGLNAL